MLRVHSGDAGAYDDAGVNQSLGVELSDEAFNASIDDTGPGAYNEWRMRGARPIGIFVLNPANIVVRRKFSFEDPYGSELGIAAQPISLGAIRSMFPGQPIWTMTPDGAREL